MQSRHDIAIIGAGPTGLACALLAAKRGLSVVVVEKGREEVLAAPAPDGRDIALTHRSVQILDSIGVWQRLPDADIAPIRRAKVRNAGSGDLLDLDAAVSGQDVLGHLVGNDVIRKGLYERAAASPAIDLVTGTGVEDVILTKASAQARLASGAAISASLLIAADSRFSEMRRKAGIGAEMRDFGRVCIVCRMRHEIDHDDTAYEWFDTDQTLAVLPLNGRLSSIVTTLPADAAVHAMSVSPQGFAADVERRFGGKWGRMELVGERHHYPLVAVYAHRFFAERFALVGDAAVGMHPVTAHGYNFGLAGADRLVRELGRVADMGGDVGAREPLAAYDSTHRRATYPLYQATNALVALYTDNRPLALFAREGLLRLGNILSPAKALLMRKLTDIGPGPASPRVDMQHGA